MNAVIILGTIVLIIERLSEVLFGLLFPNGDDAKRKRVLPLVVLSLSVVACMSFRINILSGYMSDSYATFALTGIAAGGGAEFFHQVLNQLTPKP